MTDAQFIAWLKDSTAIRCVLVEVNVKSGGSETTRYLSNKGYVTSPTDTPANTRYIPCIVGGIQFTETLSIDGTASLSSGDIEIENVSGDKDSWFNDVWANRSIKVYIGDVRWIRSDFRLVFDGITATFDTKARNRFNLRISDKLQRLNTPVTEHKLGGTTPNADRLVPICLGECHNVEPLLVDPVVNEYQVHDGPIESIIEVRDNGVPVSFTPFLTTGKFRLTAQPSGQITASVQGSKTDLTYSANKVGTDGTFDAVGNWVPGTGWSISGGKASGITNGAVMFYYGVLTIGKRIVIKYRLLSGSAPLMLNMGPSNSHPTPTTSADPRGGTLYTYDFITSKADIRIYSNGTTSSIDDFECYEVIDGATYRTTVAQMVKLLATSYGNAASRFTYSELDLTAFDAFDTANPQQVGLYMNDRTNVIEAMNKLAASVGGRVFPTRAGLLSIVKLTLPQGSAGTSVTATDIVQQSLSISQLPPVKAACQIGYCKNWTVEQTVAAGVPVNHADLYKQEWLTITQTDSSTAAAYKTFVAPVMEETLLLTNADATAEASRRLNMWNVQRKVVKYTGMPWLMLETLGNPQTITNSRFGLSGGVRGQIISLATDWLNPHITVEILL